MNFINISDVYKKRLIINLSIIFLLIFIYVLTFIFDSQAMALKSSNYIWLEERFFDLISRIEIFGTYRIPNTGNNTNTIILDRKNNNWVISQYDLNGNIIDYPARQSRVEDFLSILSRRDNYPIRSLSQTMETAAFGNEPSRITVYGGSGPPLLDMFVGFTDHSTSHIFLRKYGEREIRTGQDIFSLYTDNDISFWYDLRLFPDINPAMVQRLHILNIENQDISSISRSLNVWINEKSTSVFPGADSYIRFIIESRAEGFIYHDNIIIQNSIILELGDGSIRFLDIGFSDNDSLHIAKIRGLPYVYYLSEWTVNNLLMLDALL